MMTEDERAARLAVATNAEADAKYITELEYRIRKLHDLNEINSNILARLMMLSRTVFSIHFEDMPEGICNHCHVPWPCAEYKAIKEACGDGLPGDTYWARKYRAPIN